MIIDRAARVVPPPHANKAISRTMGDLIGKADRDDMLAALLWTGECRIAQRVATGWHQHADRLGREKEESARRKGPVYTYYFTLADQWRARIPKACQDAAGALHEQIASELEEADEAVAECEQALFELTRWLGLSLDDRQAAQRSRGFVLDELAPLDDQLQQARERLAQLLADDREKLHELALQDRYQRQHAATNAKNSLADIDRMAPEVFAQLVQDLLEAEGCTALDTWTEETSTIVMRTAGGHTVAFSAHHLAEPAFGSKRNLPLAALRRARHAAAQGGAEAVVIAVNGHLTLPAYRYAEANPVILLERGDLEAWAVWGRPLDLDRLLTGAGEN
ncbi:restriction endonuclease [Kitasatospora sp. NPDC101157]|uniref:restriction endonuclease n=1 Tax=Kitasatospora sp. NPDC101157 TaxID=3364098 RepID=UPI00381152D1